MKKRSNTETGVSAGANPHTCFLIVSNYVSSIVFMFYVYFLKSKKDQKLYIGSTNNLKRRLLEHNTGKVRSTKSRVPFELRYYEAFSNEEDARHREWSLKRDGNALAQLKRRISKSLL